MIDAYTELIPEYISKEEFFRFGLEKTIYIPDEKVKQEWTKLKSNILNNKEVFMRGHKGSVENRMFLDFYRQVFENERVKKDPSNSQNPSKIIEKLTGYKKSKDLKNYQLASIFGRSRNIYTFCAPWNIVFVPNLLDPFLNAEATSELAKEYQAVFKKHSYEKFKPYIDEYNEIVGNAHFQRKIDEFFTQLYDFSINDRDVMQRVEVIISEEISEIKV